MHFLRTVRASVTVAICCLSTVVAAERVSTFSSLPSDDELEVKYASRGCFHSHSYELKFRRSAEVKVRIFQLQPVWSVDKMSITGTNRVMMGDLTVTKKEVEGLDRLLEFYRSKPRGGCTTVDTISISQYRDGTLIATEQFEDASCSGMKDMTPIMELVAGIKEPR